MTTQEAIDKVVKILGEVKAIKTALADAQANGDTVPAALEAAINAVDDLNPDTEAEIAPAE